MIFFKHNRLQYTILLFAIVVELFALLGEPLWEDQSLAFEAVSNPANTILSDNGWYQHNGRVIWGWVEHNGWWRAGVAPNLTRRSVGDSKGDVRPNRTEDLNGLTDNMLRYAYPGFEHNFGLWYERRRDEHDTECRNNPDVVPPFLEQPWARSGTGMACDGLSKYDLTQFNPWYFRRLREFADLSDQKGTVLIHNYYMQHALLEQKTHYVDFPWRPNNTIQDTGMPVKIPAANVFYDVKDPTRRALHETYIRKVLDEIGTNNNVIHLTSQEYTGPLSFIEFWMDIIIAWEQEHKQNIHIGIQAPKDVQDAVLADPDRSTHVSTIDLRGWYYKTDGSLVAPKGGEQTPGRNFEDGFEAGQESSPEQVYRKIREYRDLYPDKALIDAIDLPKKRAWWFFMRDSSALARKMSWAFFMGGGSLLVPGQLEYPGKQDPPTYIAPIGVDIIQPTYDFINANMPSDFLKLTPQNLILNKPQHNWCLADIGNTYLIYALKGGQFQLDLSKADGEFQAQWFDPRTGSLHNAKGVTVSGGGIVTFVTPTSEDWALWLRRLDLNEIPPS